MNTENRYLTEMAGNQQEADRTRNRNARLLLRHEVSAGRKILYAHS